MKTTKISNLFKVAATAIGIISISGQAASAFDLKSGTALSLSFECLNDSVGLITGANATDANGWQYAFDSNRDGMNGNYWVGSAPGQTNPYDFSGLAIKETATSVIVAINSNMLLTGQAESRAVGGQVGYGDLFLNMSGKNFLPAMQSGDLFGIRFASANASGVQQLGVYSGVQAKTVTDIKDGYTVQTYGGLAGGNNSYQGQVAQGRGTVGYGDLTSSYFTNNGQNNTFNLNEIASGTYRGGITFLAQGAMTQELLNTGYNASKFGGTQTIAFKFDKSVVSVPEPATLGGLALIGATLTASKLRKQSAKA